MSENEEDLHRAILGYFAENPDAMDTLEGVAEWWVMRQRIRTSVSTVARVLHRLVEEGRVEQVGSVEQPRYRLSRLWKPNGGKDRRAH